MCCGSDEAGTPAADASYLTRLADGMAAVEAEQVAIERAEVMEQVRSGRVMERVRSGRVLVRYVGPGFVLGAPARDLTGEEWAGLAAGLQDVVALSGVYAFEFVAEDEGGVS